MTRDASGNFAAGTITADLDGNASTATTANTATTATKATSFTGSLSGDVTGTQSATVVAKVGGKTATDVAAAASAVAAATSANTASTLVERDASGDITVQDVAANDVTLSGNISFPTSASTATSGNIYKNGTLFIHNRGTSNTFVGYEAGEDVSSGSGNSAVGNGAGRNINSGQGNTLMGSSAGSSITSGYDNTVVGEVALPQLQTGHDNTVVGEVALPLLTSGSGNIAIGASAGASLTSGSDNIYIDNFGANESGTIRIGDSDQSKTFISAIRGIRTDVADALPVLIDSNGQLGTDNSSARYKKEIASMGTASDVLYSLRPVTFHYRAARVGSRLQYGLIAEEVAKVAPGLVVYKDGVPDAVLYRFLAPMLVNELQELHKTVEEQGAEIRRLEQLLEARN